MPRSKSISLPSNSSVERELLGQTCSILHSLLIFVFVSFIAEELNLNLLKLNFNLSLIVGGGLKIYCLSGIAGSLLEIISGETYIWQLRRFHENAIKYWHICLSVFVISFMIEYLLLVSFPSIFKGKAFVLNTFL